MKTIKMLLIIFLSAITLNAYSAVQQTPASPALGNPTAPNNNNTNINNPANNTINTNVNNPANNGASSNLNNPGMNTTNNPAQPNTMTPTQGQ